MCILVSLFRFIVMSCVDFGAALRLNTAPPDLEPLRCSEAAKRYSSVQTGVNELCVPEALNTGNRACVDYAPQRKLALFWRVRLRVHHYRQPLRKQRSEQASLRHQQAA